MQPLYHGEDYPAAAALGLAYFSMQYKMGKIRETITERFEADLATEAELNEIGNANFLNILEEGLGAYWE